jgi:Mlc titration factor MtfA (ptsG expression regulator)
MLHFIVFHWFKRRRRKKLLAVPFPQSWEAIVRRNVAHDKWLDVEERRYLRDLVHVFVAEKSWEGCGGLVMTDEIRVTVAAQACLLILKLPDDLYRNVHSILVYPSTVAVPAPRPEAFGVPIRPIREIQPILGEAQLRGPVILVWDAVKRMGRHPESGHNVVYHEFAHKLDMLDGRVDGTPPLAERCEIERWRRVCSREYLALRDRKARGQKSLLDAYGATNEAEFFAVVTEHFFDQPVALHGRHSELYDVLRAFYQQDPAARVAERGTRVS